MRRAFLKRAGALAGSVVTAGTISTLLAACATGTRTRGEGYGDPRVVPDTDGRAVLALPEGFQYTTFSRTGESYAPGLRVPRNHDGMACFARPDGTVRLIRNHEVRNPAGNFTNGVDMPAHSKYDARAMAGCMSLDFDPRSKRLVRQFASLGGTLVNCAGGLARSNDAWLTCEESVLGVKQGYDKPHGYCFRVPASADGPVAAEPLKAMGRFVREAAFADVDGIVYQTEDATAAAGFYRYTPERADDLTRGRLQMLAVRGRPGADLIRGQTAGTRLPVAWVDIDTPDPDLERGGASCFAQGRAKGGAAFERLEGIYRGEDGRSMYFISTTGGDDKLGQLWRYSPADELVLVLESRDGGVLESPDNLCITPNGAVLFCEDDAIGNGDTHPLATGVKEVNRLVALTPRGEPFTFAVNVLNHTEFAGACFSPDGEILFVNVYGNAAPGSGMTCAIWGPWERGPL